MHASRARSVRNDLKSHFSHEQLTVKAWSRKGKESFVDVLHHLLVAPCPSPASQHQPAAVPVAVVVLHAVLQAEVVLSFIFFT